MSSQTSAEAAAAAEAIAAPVAERPLRGGAAIALFYYGSDKPADVKRLYAEAPRLPVFQVVPRGPLHAFKSRLLKHLEMLSDAKEREIAAAAEQRRLGAGATPSKPRLKTNKPKPDAIRGGASSIKSKHREREIA